MNMMIENTLSHQLSHIFKFIRVRFYSCYFRGVGSGEWIFDGCKPTEFGGGPIKTG